MKRAAAITLFVAACAAGILLLRGRAPAASSLPQAADTTDARSFELVDEAGGSGGFTYAVDVDGSRAAFGRGREVVLADISNPSSPEEIFALRLPGEVRDVAISVDRLFVAADTAGLQIVDVGQRAVVGAIAFDDPAYGVDVQDGLAYVAARSQGLRIVDVSSLPKELGYLVTADEAVGVSVRGGYAYVAATYESFRVVDVTDPADPVNVSFAGFDSYDHGAVWSVAVDGDLGLAAIPEKGLRIIDVSDPRNVVNHSVYRSLRAPAAAALRGSTAFVADQDAGLRILDLSDPAGAVEIGRIALPGRALDVHVEGDVAFVAARDGGLRLVDVSSTNAPREIGALDIDDAVVDVVSSGGTVLAAGRENALYRYDDRNGLVRQVEGPANRIAVDGARTVAVGKDGVRIYEEGQLVAVAEGEIHGAAVNGSVLATAGPLGIRFIDLDAPGASREVADYGPSWNRDVGNLLRTPPAAWDVLLRDGLAFAAFDDGVHVLDVSDPRAPSRVGRLATPERVYRLAFAGDVLVAAGDDGVRLVDVSNPSSPRAAQRIKTPSFATSLSIADGEVFVGDLSGHVTRVNLADGQALGSWRVADRVLGLAQTEGGLAVAAGGQGLRVVKLTAGGR